MLKKRLIGVVVVRDGVAVQSIAFSRWLPIGRPEVVVEALNQWGVDEIAVVDTTASRTGRAPDFVLATRLSRWCQVPLTFGGGIRTVDDMTRLVQAGADKVMVNRAFVADPSLISAGAHRLGNQCIVASIDLQRDDSGLRVWDHVARAPLAEDPVTVAKRAEDAGVGEVFLNSVDRDGAKRGYDIEGASRVASALSVPVILCGGVGHPAHFGEGLALPNISAVAAANFFSFTEHSVTTAKQFLLRAGVALRQDTYFDYADASFTEAGRVAKRDDRALKEMLFEFHPREVI